MRKKGTRGRLDRRENASSRRENRGQIVTTMPQHLFSHLLVQPGDYLYRMHEREDHKILFILTHKHLTIFIGL